MSNMMRALVKAKPEVGLWMEHVPVPEVGPNDVLIRVKKSAICGTDVHIWNWDSWAQKTIPVPMVVGHEFVGEIAEVGSSVTQVPGRRGVSGEGHIVCGKCRNCRAGVGICATTRRASASIAPAPLASLSASRAQCRADPGRRAGRGGGDLRPFGNAVHTGLSFDLVGEDVLVTGAGPIGIMGAMVAKRSGARKVVTPTSIRCASTSPARSASTTWWMPQGRIFRRSHDGDRHDGRLRCRA